MGALSSAKRWAIAIGLPIIISCSAAGPDTASGTTGKSSSETETPAEPKKSAEHVKKETAQAEKDVREELGTVWQYSNSDDEMGRGKIKTAVVRSLKEFEFDFPYADPQRASLTLRVHPKYGKDVILSIERGQFTTDLDGTTVNVKFDGEKPRSYKAAGAEDFNSTVLFIQNYDQFLAKAKKAKRVFIEASFFQEGARVFEFDISNLKF